MKGKIKSGERRNTFGFHFLLHLVFLGVSYSIFQIEYVMIGFRIHNHYRRNNSDISTKPPQNRFG